MNSLVIEKDINNCNLKKDDLEKFKKNGWIGPFDSGASSDLIARCQKKSENIIDNKIINPIYKRYSVRDLHLVDDDFLELFKQDNIVHRCQSILGNDLKLWRSKIFKTPSGAKGIGWHQEWGYFNGEEIGNDIPGLHPESFDDCWNLSVWVALVDITPQNSPMQFVTGSHKIRHAIKMVSITESAFFENPFNKLLSKDELIEKCKKSTLLLDINTEHLLDGIDLNDISLENLKKECYERLKNYKAAITQPFDTEGKEETVLMKKGQFVLFSERTMHRSLANTTDGARYSVNCRITPQSTTVYPGKLKGEIMDGSNLNITDHYCIDLS